MYFLSNKNQIVFLSKTPRTLREHASIHTNTPSYAQSSLGVTRNHTLSGV